MSARFAGLLAVAMLAAPRTSSASCGCGINNIDVSIGDYCNGGARLVCDGGDPTCGNDTRCCVWCAANGACAPDSHDCPSCDACAVWMATGRLPWQDAAVPVDGGRDAGDGAAQPTRSGSAGEGCGCALGAERSATACRGLSIAALAAFIGRRWRSRRH